MDIRIVQDDLEACVKCGRRTEYAECGVMAPMHKEPIRYLVAANLVPGDSDIDIAEFEAIAYSEAGHVDRWIEFDRRNATADYLCDVTVYRSGVWVFGTEKYLGVEPYRSTITALAQVRSYIAHVIACARATGKVPTINLADR